MEPILKYPGSKWRLTEWIISHFPPHETYLEPFFGSGAVFFNKTPSRIETINDIDDNVVNLFKVIRDQPEELAAMIELTPWARNEYYASYEKTGEPLEDARRFLVRCWQSFGCRTFCKTGWSSNCGSNGPNFVDRWTQMPELIIAAAKRFQKTQIENQPAIKLIGRYNKEDVLIYADPPYPLSTRAGKYYAHEMTDEDHIQLLEALDNHTGPVIISGYACPLYDERLRHWDRRTHKALAEGGVAREEVLWLNPVAAKWQNHLFSIGSDLNG